MFKLTNDSRIIRVADGAIIPADPRNRDRQAYDAWVAAGNVPQAADPLPVPLDLSDLDQPSYRATKSAMLVMATWNGKTPAQAKAAFKAAWDALS